MENLVYLVAVPTGKLLHCSRKIQKFLWDKYNLHIDQQPEIHLTMDAVYYENSLELEKLTNALQEILKDIPSFEVMANGFSYIPCPYNCITIHIVKTKELKSIYEHIHEGLIRKGFRVRAFHSHEIIFHISLAGIYGRPWTEEESQNAWQDVKDFQFQCHSRINELQLWYPDVHSDKKVIAKFQLFESKDQ
ncbi:2'-5' RNA ligase family protein [Thermotalea metallivorans]|uniref:RNA 2',3'-cyclic phosphodiesterase n=1 Tax=Thermotalea metallivorans TaxID=520762 RepID=A0A140L9J1_9FIRM|nr:2'-5' RNA ligase family protein [Thermotalea metallivorans]KXG77216.1 hypothetical protein AN619_07460 [Thermotalea metallivorans]